MRGKLVLFLSLVFLSHYALAQKTPTITMDFSRIKRDSTRRQVFGQASYRVDYRLRHTPNRSKPEDFIDAHTVLLRGEKYSEFIGRGVLYADSAYNAMMRSDMSMSEILGKTIGLQGRVNYRTMIIKSYPRVGICTFQNDIPGGKYRYENDVTDLKWTIHPTAKDIAGYKCQMASCAFRGRTYTAWYAPEIPIADGPYVFSGLPGLILEIHDSQHYFHFTFNGLRKLSGWNPIYLHSSNVVETDRPHFRKIYENMLKDPCATFKAYNDPCPEEVRRREFTPEPYNPIELW